MATLLTSPDLESLKGMVESYIEDSLKYGYDADDEYVHQIFEAAVMAFFGGNVFDELYKKCEEIYNAEEAKRKLRDDEKTFKELKSKHGW